MEFVKETSPHVKRKDNLTWMLLDVIIALAPVILAALVFHPLDALRSILLSVASMELCEFLFVYITKKDVKAFKMQNFLSALISALIYSLIMPSNPGWESGMGSGSSLLARPLVSSLANSSSAEPAITSSTQRP